MTTKVTNNKLITTITGKQIPRKDFLKALATSAGILAVGFGSAGALAKVGDAALEDSRNQTTITREEKEALKKEIEPAINLAKERGYTVRLISDKGERTISPTEMWVIPTMGTLLVGSSTISTFLLIHPEVLAKKREENNNGT